MSELSSRNAFRGWEIPSFLMVSIFDIDPDVHPVEQILIEPRPFQSEVTQSMFGGWTRPVLTPSEQKRKDFNRHKSRSSRRARRRNRN